MSESILRIDSIRRRESVATVSHTLPPLLVSRQQAARLLGYQSIDPVKELERQGRLTPVRPTGKPTGQVFYRYAEIERIANEEATDDAAHVHGPTADDIAEEADTEADARGEVSDGRGAAPVTRGRPLTLEPDE